MRGPTWHGRVQQMLSKEAHTTIVSESTDASAGKSTNAVKNGSQLTKQSTT